MKFDVNKISSTSSDRVKGIDFHPTEPWVLTTLYSGRVEIWSYETNTLVKAINVTDVPCRAGKFIARKNWIIVGSDDFHLRVYNYNTGEKIAQFEAHPDYIRSIAIHPTRSYVVTSSDDYTIKLWNWENNWKLEQTFEGHQHYIMSLAFNPKDDNTFASACLDKTVKIWSLGSKVPNFTLLAPESKGFNYVDYYPHGDKPYLLTASDDKTVKIWDYQTKSCVATLEGHLSNVSFAVFHPELPLIISGSEDSTIKAWNSNTYKLETTLNYQMERAWCIATRKGSGLVAIGFDTGHIVAQFGDDKPLLSMDPMGKVISCKHMDIYNSVIKSSDTQNLEDGEILSLTQKELGNIEIFPSSLNHSPNGRFVTVTGDNEYIIYTALAWRNKMYGAALDFVWGQDSNYYAIINPNKQVIIYKNFKEKTTGQISNNDYTDKLFGGPLLSIRRDGEIEFYNWETGDLVRRVDVDAEDVIWSENGELVLIVSSDSAYALKFDKDIFQEHLSNGTIDPDEGCEECFEVIYDVKDEIISGKWVGDVFIYTSSSNRLNYLVGGKVNNLAHFDKTMYLLGYLPRDNKVYVSDKDVNIVSYYLSLAVLEFQTVVLRGELDQADELLSNVDEKDIPKISRFLEQQGFKEKALEISNDLEQKFELAIETLNLKLAKEIAEKDGTPHKWKKLGDVALKNWNLKLAIESFENCSDYQSLLLLYTSINNVEGLKKLSELCVESGKFNLAFSSSWAANDLSSSIKILQLTDKFAESSLLSLTYTDDNSKVSENVKLWKDYLIKQGKEKLSNRLYSPDEAPKEFPQLNGNNLIDLDGTQPDAVEETAEEEVEVEVEAEEEEAEAEAEEEEEEEEVEEEE